MPIQYPVSTSTNVEHVQTVPEIPNVPFYSQFADIQSANWQKKACGVTSLAMLIDYYKPNSVTPQKMLTQGLNSGAYVTNAGWSHQGLANLVSKYGLVGKTYDLSKLNSKIALEQFKDILKDGPVMASIYYKFDPKSTIPHLVVIVGIDGDTVYYNDPSAKGGDKEISITNFMKGWKKRLIVVRPTDAGNLVALK